LLFPNHHYLTREAYSRAYDFYRPVSGCDSTWRVKPDWKFPKFWHPATLVARKPETHPKVLPKNFWENLL